MKANQIKLVEDVLPKSRTQKKHDAQNITKLVTDLIKLNQNQIKSLPTSDAIKYEILKAESMQKIALKRQIGFISKLIRKNENLAEELQITYQKILSASQEHKTYFHYLETLRNQLINPETSKEILSKIVTENPKIDTQKIRQVIRQAQAELKKEKPSLKYNRELFQIIKKEITP